MSFGGDVWAKSLVNDLLRWIIRLASSLSCPQCVLSDQKLLAIETGPSLFLKNGLVKPLLLLLHFLFHVVVDLALLLVKDAETVFKGHLTLQIMVLPKELSISVLTAVNFERSDVDTLETFL